MRTWIPLPRLEGDTSRQAHCDLPEGTFERECGREGFFGPATHIYHQNPPTGWIDWEGPLRPRAFDLTRREATRRSPFDADLLMHNAHCRVRWWRLAEPMVDLARNADGDELLFVHVGAGDLFSDYGRLAIGEGDYVVLPRGTQWRLAPTAEMTLLLVEATNDAYKLPDRGMLGPHAVFDPAVLRTPVIDAAFRAQQGDHRTRVVIKRREQLSTVTFPFNPLDATGWHGNLSVVALNWRDIRPLMSHRYHLPPSAHTTFVASRFAVCTFAPRPIESDPGALKVPFFHSNEDYDEVLFYHRGSFFSRDNIHPGMMTLHPAGFAHGPHPKALATGLAHARTETDEVAVMIDTRDALDLAPAATAVEWDGYVRSWQVPVPA
ncbi:MAG: homogentisate 1,2-dioxygenase [Alphaproteobacteria bacterium]|nr:homogentisate 1,2-dioxygenase [Alphaproteobacteria bacterium]